MKKLMSLGILVGALTTCTKTVNVETIPDLDERCYIKLEDFPTDTGECRALWQNYYYSQVSNSCLEYEYGGCYPSPVGFVSEISCRVTCVK